MQDTFNAGATPEARRELLLNAGIRAANDKSTIGTYKIIEGQCNEHGGPTVPRPTKDALITPLGRGHGVR